MTQKSWRRYKLIWRTLERRAEFRKRTTCARLFVTAMKRLTQPSASARWKSTLIKTGSISHYLPDQKASVVFAASIYAFNLSWVIREALSPLTKDLPSSRRQRESFEFWREGRIINIKSARSDRLHTAVFMWHFGNMSANKSFLITDVTFMATSAMQAHRWSRPCIKMYGKYRWRTAIDSSLLLCTAHIYKCLLRVESFYGETERWIP